MTDFATLLQQGTGQAWLFLPMAVTLGALHGLEPGHSKTLMASYIVATRGGGREAALLGISAALSHSLVVWLLAAVALTFGDALIADHAEPYIMLASGLIVVGMAALMLRRAGFDGNAHGRHHAHAHGAPEHDHDHAHDARPAVQGKATTTQVIAFGLTGGLLPCPAAVTVLLICLNLKRAVLGAGMVAAFSAGLALTLIGVGLAAAWGTRQIERWLSANMEAWLGRLPYLSSLLVASVGVVMAAMGAARL